MKEKYKAMIRESGKWHDILPIAIIWSVMLLWSVFKDIAYRNALKYLMSGYTGVIVYEEDFQ